MNIWAAAEAAVPQTPRSSAAIRVLLFDTVLRMGPPMKAPFLRPRLPKFPKQSVVPKLGGRPAGDQGRSGENDREPVVHGRILGEFTPAPAFRATARSRAGTAAG